LKEVKEINTDRTLQSVDTITPFLMEAEDDLSESGEGREMTNTACEQYENGQNQDYNDTSEASKEKDGHCVDNIVSRFRNKFDTVMGKFKTSLTLQTPKLGSPKRQGTGASTHHTNAYYTHHNPSNIQFL